MTRVRRDIDRCRSLAEKNVYKNLKDKGISFAYESEVLPYVQPARNRTYKPDFVVVLKNGRKRYIEVKGNFNRVEREKFLNIVNSNPDKDIRILLLRDNKLTKSSRIRYSDWCETKGIKYAIGTTVPPEWLT